MSQARVHLRPGQPPKGFCGSCGGQLTNGQCDWCDRYEDVMGVFA